MNGFCVNQFRYSIRYSSINLELWNSLNYFWAAIFLSFQCNIDRIMDYFWISFQMVLFLNCPFFISNIFDATKRWSHISNTWVFSIKKKMSCILHVKNWWFYFFRSQLIRRQWNKFSIIMEIHSKKNWNKIGPTHRVW